MAYRAILKIIGYTIIAICLFFIIGVTFYYNSEIGLVRFIKNIFGGEREGILRIIDCRELVEVDKNGFDTYFHKYTCFDNNSIIESAPIGNICCRIKMDGSLCRVAYCYEKDVLNAERRSNE